MLEHGMMRQASVSGTTACRTVDKVDIFGDNSGKALYRLDGNANDESGIYHGTETAITYGGGVYERGAVFNGTSSGISISAIPTAVSLSFWTNKPLTNSQTGLTLFGADGTVSLNNGEWSTSFTNESLILVYVEASVLKAAYITATSFNNSDWKHIVVQFNSTGNYSIYVNGVSQSLAYYGTSMGNCINKIIRMGNNTANWFNGSLDQVRFFNRAITATEVSMLYAECGPTSTVSDSVAGAQSGATVHYSMEGNTNDVIGNYNATSTDVTYVPSSYGQAAVFNGTTSRIDTPIARTMMTSGFSFSMRVKVNTAGVAYGLLGQNNVAGYLIRCIINNNKVNWTMYTDETSMMFAVETTTQLSANTVYHIGLAWDGTTNSGAVKIYINGALDVSGTSVYTASNIGNITGMFLGRASDGYALDGTLDEVSFFSRGITEAEISSLYAGTYNLTASTSSGPSALELQPFGDGSCQAIYRFNGDATDATGTYNGTATNVTYGTGKFGQCVITSGSNSKVNTGIISSTYYISFWYYHTSGVEVTCVIGSNKLSTYYYGFVISALATNKIRLGVYTSPSSTSVDSTLLLSSGWNHIYVKVVSGSSELYVNGIKYLTNSGACSFISSELQIGYMEMTGAYFAATIDQLRIFNKALTPMEVASLYNETTPLEEPMSSLVDPFRDGSGKALYRLEGNALDESGNYNGTATAVTYGAGRFGRCFVGNATSARVDIGTTIFNPNMNAFAISMWFKTASIPAGNNTPFWKLSRFGFNLSTDTNIISYPNRITFSIMDTTDTWVKIFPDVDTTLNVWTHVVVNYVNNSSIRMFINGVLQSTQENNQLGMNTSSLTYSSVIGAGNNNGTYSSFFNGSIDQFRVFSRVLTAGEVTTLYTEGA